MVRMSQPETDERFISRRLAQDAWITREFLESHLNWHGSKIDARQLAEAELYRRWCRQEALESLDAVWVANDPDALAGFVQEWRRRAVGADVRGSVKATVWAILGAALLFVAVLEFALGGSSLAVGVPLASALAAGAVAWYAKSVLLVGPEAPRGLTHTFNRLGDYPLALHRLVFKLANFRRI